MTDYHRAIKEFFIKALESLLAGRCEAPGRVLKSSQQGNPWLQLSVEENFGVRTAFPTIWNHDLSSRLEIHLELLLAAPQCTSLLLERWDFLFSPTETCSAPDTPFTFLKKSSISLRSLLLTALLTPAHTQFRGYLDYRIRFNSTDLTQWSGKEVQNLPKNTFKLQSPIGSVSAKVQFLRDIPVPELISGDLLGIREKKAICTALESWSDSDGNASSVLGTSMLFSQTLAELSKEKRPLNGENGSFVVPVRYKGLELAGESEDSSDEEWLIGLKDREKECNPFAEMNLSEFCLKCRETQKKRHWDREPGADLEGGVSELRGKLREMQQFRSSHRG